VVEDGFLVCPRVVQAMVISSIYPHPRKCISSSPRMARVIYLQQTQILQSSLDQLLYPSLLRLVLVLAEGVSRLATGIFTEVVVGKLGRLPQQGPELNKINVSKS